MKILSILLFVILIFQCTAQIELKQYSNDKIGLKETTLSNGMKVFLIENHNKPEIFGSFVINVGSKNDPEDNTGMAHYLEHMLFKGTQTMGTTDYAKEKVHLDKINELYNLLGQEKDDEKRLAIQKQINEESKLAGEYALPNEFDRIIAKMGGTDLNAFTSNDMTVYLNKFPPNQLERWLDVYVHRFQEPVFRLFQSELETVYEEKNRAMNEPMQYLFERYTKLAFKGHPYGDKTTIGETEHLKNPSLEAMYDYYYKYYVANNMALVLAGDFDAEEAIKIIEKKLLRLPKSNLKKEENFSINPIQGKTIEIIKSSPIKMAVYGYRTEGMNKANKAKNDLLIALLQNESETGLIDQLLTEGKTMGAYVFDYSLKEHGSIAIMNIPKIVGQSFEKAEVLLMAQLDSLKSGDFSNELFNSVKNALIKYKKMNLEDNESLSYLVYDYYISHNDWNKVINYDSELESLTKEDIVKYANQIFQDDYVVIYSKMGKTKMEKLKKPPFKPMPSMNNQKSKYYDIYNKIEAEAMAVNYVDFKEDIQTVELNNITKLNIASNPKNNIFNLTYKWSIGNLDNDLITPMTTYLNLVSSKDQDFKTYRLALQKLNASYYFESDEKSFQLFVDGEDEHLKETIEIINSLITNPAKNETKLREVIQEEKYYNKENKSSPSSVVRLLREYALYKDQSLYLNKKSIKELGSVTTDDYVNTLSSIIENAELNINYVGNNQEVQKLISNQINSFNQTISKSSLPKYYTRKPLYEKENTIYFINDKKATQTNIYFNIDLSNIPTEEHYKLYAFNEYFGKGMSSLVFQEIREFRSLAYSAYGICRIGELEEMNENFIGYIGCQNDKTIEAMQTMMGLINNMPLKPERIGYLKGAIINSAITARPGFRNISEQIEKWKLQGYNEDPNLKFSESYKSLTYNEIVEFYNQYLKNKPVTISIVGDKRQINIKELANFGKIIELKTKDIYID